MIPLLILAAAPLGSIALAELFLWRRRRARGRIKSPPCKGGVEKTVEITNSSLSARASRVKGGAL
jgi:hypothetical protein